MTLYQPIATCDIPMPIVEPTQEEREAELPRILQQVAGTRAASRRVISLTLVFLAIAAIEGVLLFRMPNPEPLVVYHDVPRITLMESQK